MTKVFVSFRNGDEPFAAALLYQALCDRLGVAAVFRSSNSIPAGAPFADVIWDRHRESAVVVVVVGPRWLTAVDRQGRRALWQRDDWVRREVADAFEQGKHVIPVVLAGVPRMRPADLPPSLAGLAALQAVPMDHRTVDAAVGVLADRVTALTAAPPPDSPAPSADSPAPVADAPAPVADSGAVDAGAATMNVGSGAAEAASRAGDAASGAAFSGAGAGDGARLRSAAPEQWLRVHNLPAPTPDLIDRDAALDAVREAVLAAGGRRPVLLHGPVGTGKSQLAAAYARRYAGDYDLVWRVDATGAALVGSGLAALAQRIGHDLGGDVPAGLPALLDRSRRTGRWLLVFDGAGDPAAVPDTIVQAAAGVHVVITSRQGDWGLRDRVAVPVGPFARDQAVAVLAGLVPHAGADDLDRLAAALDDLPLAVAQAGVLLSGGTVTAGQYLDLLARRTGDLLRRGVTHRYPTSLAAAWSAATDRVADAGPAAGALLDLLACLGPAPVPFDVLGGADGPFDGDPIALDDAVRAVAGSGLVPVRDGGCVPSPLLQTYLRDHLDPARRDDLRGTARRLLARAPRPDPREPDAATRYLTLLPHALALDLAADDDPAVHDLLLDLVQHAVVHGDAQLGADLAADAARRWRERPGLDPAAAYAADAQHAKALYRSGRFAAAVRLDEGVATHCLRRHGPDHPATLLARHNLAMDRWAAGHRDQARTSLQDVLERRHRVLGAGHPDTLRSAHNLALAVRAAGSAAEARDLEAGAHAGLVAALGADHPDTLDAAAGVAVDLRAAGLLPEATAVERDTYRRLCRVLGGDHPRALRSGYLLAVGLRSAGDPARATALAELIHTLCLRVLGERHVDTARVALLLGGLLTATGDPGRGTTLRASAAARLRALTTPPPRT